ncbi:hypothetical protein J6590_014147 [Homalodisca vitripennis]|nr:hypothetical protein J6590_014147 [Homalodisca vitripennis]
MGVRTLERAAQPRPPRNNSAARTLGRSRAEFVPLGRRGAARRVYSVRRQRNRFLAAVTFGCLRTTSAIVGEMGQYPGAQEGRFAVSPDGSSNCPYTSNSAGSSDTTSHDKTYCNM